MNIETVADFYKAIISGPYTWPGGYPRYWLMSDGAACQFSVGLKETRLMIESIQADDNGGWRPIALEVNWEDKELFCAHTDLKIESAYGSD